MPALHSRRAFLGYGAALAALAARPASGAFASAAPPALAIVDHTIPGADEFAAVAERRGVRVLAIAGDVGGAWMHQVEPLWRAGRGRVAGFTRTGALFCLELLARDYGVAVERRARHAPAPDGGFAHAAAGCDAAHAETMLAAAGPRWVGEAARLALTPASPPSVRLELVEPATPDDIEPAPVYSWVIGPRARPAA
ncbi:MAG TPA: hypothetical protein VIN61_04520 [Gammaproteobacteria bacterium]